MLTHKNSHHDQLVLILYAFVWVGGCYNGTFLAGKSCQSDDDCGPDLRCQNGFCGGVAPAVTDAGTAAPGSSGTTNSISTSTSTGLSTLNTMSSGDTDATVSMTIGPTTGELTATTGEECNCQAVDVLVVYDQAESMLPYEDKVIAVLVELYTILEEALADACEYHVGLTFTSEVLHNDPECQAIGSLLRNNTTENCSELHMGGKPYIDENDDLAAGLLCLLSAGSTGALEEQNSRPALAITEAISPVLNAQGACNEGFFRPEAALAIMLVTAEEDNRDEHSMGNGSPGNPIQWFNEIVMLNDLKPQRIGLAAIIPPLEPTPGCELAPAPRLHEFVDFWVDDNTILLNLCDDEQTLVDTFSSELQTALFDNACSDG